MPYGTGALLGNGYGPVSTDITEKDLEMIISNEIKDKTTFVNMAMSRSKKIDNTTHAWGVDTFRRPAIQARAEGAAVSAADVANPNRSALSNIAQIFQTTIGNTGTARAIVQAGGDPQVYEQAKNLTQLYFDVEAQMVRNDQIGTKYQGQAGIAAGGANTGRRFGSLPSFAGTQSFNTTAGTAATMSSNVNNIDTDVVVTSANLTMPSDGSTYYTGTFTTQGFSPVIYRQMVSIAEARYNAKVATVVAPTSMRTMLSDQFPQSRSINRVDSSRGDSITTFEGDFGYTYEIGDNWIMDNTSSSIGNSVFFVNPDAIQWGSLRDLSLNPEVVSQADASLEQYIVEGTLIVRNPAGVAVLNQVSSGATPATTARDSSLVQRTNTGRLNTYI